MTNLTPIMDVKNSTVPTEHFNVSFKFQLRLPLVGFIRPPVHIPPQPSVLESGPSLYEDAVRKDDSKDGEKDGEAGTSSLKTQVIELYKSFSS